MKELSSSQTAPTDDDFSTETGLELGKIDGPVHCLWMSGSSVEIRNKGSAGVRPLPLQCLSEFFPVEEKINCLGNEFSVRTFHRWGWPGIYNG